MTAEPLPPWQIETEMMQLGLTSGGVPIHTDPLGDGTNRAGTQPRPLSPDLDLLRALAGEAPLDQSFFGPGGFFDCADTHVLCGNPVPIGGNNLVLVAFQTDGPINLLSARNAQLAVAFDRQGTPNAPDNDIPFGGADLVLVADLGTQQMFQLLFGQGGFQQGQTPGRLRIDGDTGLFVMPMGPSENPRFELFSIERVGNGPAADEMMDALTGPELQRFLEVTLNIPTS